MAGKEGQGMEGGEGASDGKMCNEVCCMLWVGGRRELNYWDRRNWTRIGEIDCIVKEREEHS